MQHIESEKLGAHAQNTTTPLEKKKITCADKYIKSYCVSRNVSQSPYIWWVHSKRDLLMSC